MSAPQRFGIIYQQELHGILLFFFGGAADQVGPLSHIGIQSKGERNGKKE